MSAENLDHDGEYLEEEDYIIPPQILLAIAGLGLLAALVVGTLQTTFGVVGWGSLGVSLIALFAWALLAPDQLLAAFTGRTAKFGGTTVVVTAIFIAALAAVYVLVRDQNLRLDLTVRDAFSLTDEGREAIRRIGVDPNAPNIEILAFYDVNAVGRRDQDAVLYDDYVAASGGKISYQLADIDRNPALADRYGITATAQLAVTTVDANGEPEIENAEIVQLPRQEDITNAILRLAAAGDFRAYFLNVENGLSLEASNTRGMSVLRDVLELQFDWAVRPVSFFELTNSQSDIALNDPSADGEVLVIAGGTKPLAEQELELLTDYVANGGDLVIFAEAGINNDGNTTLATGAGLSDFLWQSFGLRFEDDVVIDPVQAFQSPVDVVADDFDASHTITQEFSFDQSFLVFGLAQSITVADAAPPDVQITELVRSASSSYAKTDKDAIIEGDIARAVDDVTGPLVLAAAAENTATGARVVLLGSATLAIDDFAPFQNIANLRAAFNSLVWATRFDDFFSQVTVVNQRLPQDIPISMTAEDQRLITLITTVLLPFGMLGVGVLVWWNKREKGHAA